MKALTIWQPWASLIAIGAKPYEFRSWPAPKGLRGQRIVIHAGVRPLAITEMRALRIKLHSADHWLTGLHREPAIALLDKVFKGEANLPLGHALGTAVLGEPTKSPDLPGTPECGDGLNDSDRHEHANWAWPLTGWQHFDPPVPCRGAQGFWTWPWPVEEAA